MKYNTLLILYLLILFASCSGQNISRDTAKDHQADIAIGDTVAEPGKNLFIIYQATNGNYWFGSNDDGVYKYDGKTTIHYSVKDGICDTHIREIREDQSGNIFFSTQGGGISKFDGKKFTTLPVTKSSTPEKDWKLEPGDMWFKGETGKNGPYRYDGKNLYHLEFPKHPMEDAYYAQSPNRPWSPYEVYHIYKDTKGSIWFGTSNFGICRYDGKNLEWMYEEHLTLVEGGGSFGIRSIMEDKEGKFWFCNTQYRYDIQSDKDKTESNGTIDYKKEKGIDLKAPDGTGMIYFMSAIKDDKGDLWMATYGVGVWRYDGKEVTHYPIKKGNADINLYSIYKDRQGNLWLGTHENGAYRFNGNTFEPFRLAK